MNLYDFDKTIYDGDSTVDFFLYALKKKPSLVRYVPRQALGFFKYFMGKIDKTHLKEYFFCFLKGVSAQDLAEDFWAFNEKKIFAWYLQQREADDVVISASPEFLLRPICQRLGIKSLIASDVDVCSGKFSGENCYGEEKVKRLKKAFGELSVDSFYSDSESDLPLAQIANKAYLIKNGRISSWTEENKS